MLEALCRDEFAREPSHRGLLKNSCYSKPHNEGLRSATMFRDLFTEALCRVILPGKFRPLTAVPTLA
jgi:unsaturated chondroitin disaccharide hydrolase